ncbi:MAG: hypothetical protein HPY54_16910 [Chthonomonadetes bacterium]|nr:hypothetical protein [Chthonomonadetes bacterium]
MYKTTLTIITGISLLSLIAVRSLAQQTSSGGTQELTRFSDAYQQVLKRYSVNILCEEYLSGDVSNTWSEPKMPRAEQAVDSLATSFQREIIKVGDTFVLRAKNWTLRRLQDEYAQKHYGLKWRDDGNVNITTSDQKGKQLLNISATAVPISRFTKVLSQITGWNIQVEEELQSVRVSVRWQDALLGEVLEALALLLNADKQVSFYRSQQQKQREAEQVRQATDPLSEEEKASDLLLPKLVELLTPEELARWMDAEPVRLPLTRIPSQILPEVLNYVSMRFEQIVKVAPPQTGLSHELLNDYQNIFLELPRPDGRIIGVFIRNPNGPDYLF